MPAGIAGRPAAKLKAGEAARRAEGEDVAPPGVREEPAKSAEVRLAREAKGGENPPGLEAVMAPSAPTPAAKAAPSAPATVAGAAKGDVKVVKDLEEKAKAEAAAGERAPAAVVLAKPESAARTEAKETVDSLKKAEESADKERADKAGAAGGRDVALGGPGAPGQPVDGAAKGAGAAAGEAEDSEDKAAAGPSTKEAKPGVAGAIQPDRALARSAKSAIGRGKIAAKRSAGAEIEAAGEGKAEPPKLSEPSEPSKPAEEARQRSFGARGGAEGIAGASTARTGGPAPGTPVKAKEVAGPSVAAPAPAPAPEAAPATPVAPATMPPLAPSGAVRKAVETAAPQSPAEPAAAQSAGTAPKPGMIRVEISIDLP